VGGIVGGLPAEVAQPTKVVRVGGNIVAPKLVRRVDPVYPALAAQARLSAIVILEALVDTRGHVKSVSVLRGAPLFDDPAIEAVKQWRYRHCSLSSRPSSSSPSWSSSSERGPGHEARLRAARGLVPTDLSDEADRALEHGRLLCERFGARITLYHAVEVPDPSFAHWAFAHGHEVWCLAAREAEKALRFRAERLGVPAEVVVERTSSAHRSLGERIKTTRPDLTVMATHARRGLSHLLLGSVTEKVVQQVHRPVLAIRANEHEALSLSPHPGSDGPVPLSRLPFPLGAALARAFGAEVLRLHVVPVATFATLSGVRRPARR
jgi:TonB family protein